MATSVFEANQILNITAGPYQHKHYRAKATVVYLNKVPTSQYRAVGHPIGNSVGEALVDWAAEAAGLDPIEFRRRNVMPDDSYPRVTAAGIKVADMSHQRCIDVLVERMNYAALRKEQADLRARASGDDVILRLVEGYAPLWLAALLGAAVMAAVMASDSQILALSTMFTEDVFTFYGGTSRFGEAVQVQTGRIFVIVLTLVAYFIALSVPQSIWLMITF